MKALWLALAALAVAAAALAVLLGHPRGREALKGLKAEWEVRRLAAELPGVVRTRALRLPMADGIRLRADLYRPAGAGPFPTILVRTPYGRTRTGEARHWVRLFAPAGYAVLVQDVRGRWGSEGIFAPWPNEAADGLATLDWIAAQPWSTGRVGTIGCSALGEVQWPLAARAHPAHRAMIAMGSGGAAGEIENLWNFFGMWEGGIYTLAPAFGWFTQAGGKTRGTMAPVPIDHAAGLATRPMRDAVARFRPDPTDHEALLDGFGRPGWGAANGYLDGTERIGPAALVVDTWFDHSVHGSLALWRLAQRSAPSAHALIGPGTHCDFTGPFRSGATGDYPVAPDPAYDPDPIWLAFMDRHLRDGPPADLPPLRAYRLGADRWEDHGTWPPPGSASYPIPLAGPLLGYTPDRSDSRSLVSDPADPVPSLGGALCCTGNPDDRAGPLDQRPIEGRTDLLHWTSPPLAEPLALAGPIAVHLTVSTDAPDADIVARLTEVFPDGRSITIAESGQRLRYRMGYATPAPMAAGVPTPVVVSLRDTARLIPAGHRLRLHVAGSSFPRLALNFQDGGVPHDATEPRRATLTIHAGPEPGLRSHVTVTAAAPPAFLP